MKVLIAGAGIGGLTAALCLEQAGYDIEIFDKTEELSDVGAGIQCGANALKVMGHLGLLPELLATAVAPERVEFCDHKSAEVLYTVPLGEEYKRHYGAPYLHILRSDLIGVLSSALLQRAPHALTLGKSVSHYSENTNNLVLHFTDGSSATGDCLVGADGIRSLVRSQLLSKHRPRFTGNIAWRGVLPVDKLPDNFMPTVARNFVGPSKHMVVYYLRKQKLVNFVGVVQDPRWQDDSWVNKAPWEQLQEDFKGWHPLVQQIINGVDKRQCFRWALFDHQPIKNWSSSRVTLLGDAAHATLPFMASGAAMAIEDGRILQRALDQTDDVQRGLQLYQSNRFKRTAQIQNSSRHLAKLYHMKNPFALKMAFKVMATVGKNKEQFLASYDANTVELI